MTFPILGANSAVGGYAIDNSLRFNDDDGAKLRRTPSTASNRKTWTWSCWFKLGNLGVRGTLFSSFGSTSNNEFIDFRINTSGTFSFSDYSIGIFTTTQLFRDVSAWYHVAVALDTTQATASNRLKLYINGTQVTDFTSINYPSQNTDLGINLDCIHDVGNFAFNGNFPYDGYLAEMHLVDGQALSPTSFGEFDSDSGIWKPIRYTGSYGTNGFYLDFENSGSLGADQSGNGNDFTPTNLASTDQTTDTPTNNFATMNPLHSEGITSSEGNLDILASTTFWNVATSTIPIPSSGKWYMEAKITAIQAGGHNTLGFLDANFPFTTNDTATAFTGGGNPSWITYVYFHATTDNAYVNLADGSGYAFENNTTFSAGVNDILMMAFDRDNNKIWFGKNGDWAKANGTTGANPSTGADATVSSIPTDVTYMPNFGCGDSSARQQWNFGNPPYTISSGNSDDNGYGNFEYAPPTGFLSLCTQNLATELSPTIDDGSQYFSSTLYTGDGTTSNAITGVGFQGDFAWFKARSSAYSHMLFDSTRGGDARLNSDANYAESTGSDRIQSFDSDGYTISTNTAMNNNGTSFVVWSWLANAGSTSSNTDGSITSTVQANTTAGFSVVTYTGTGSDGSVGHGLGVAPKCYIIKSRNISNGWIVGHTALGTSTYPYNLILNSTNAKEGGTFDDYLTADPTSTVLNLGNAGNVNGSGDTYVAYCFAEIEGYSKFGSYTGNGSTDGTFVYTGFRPAFVICKRTNDVGYWVMFDDARQPENENNSWLLANDSSNEGTNSTGMDFVSNGFKLRNSSTSAIHNNISGSTYIYMAFAESPFVSSTSIPVTAR